MKRPAWWQDLDAEDFAWHVPVRFNIAVDSLDSQDADAPAIIETGTRDLVVSFGELRDRSRSLAAWLQGQGLAKGDRISVFLPQCWELVVAHCAAYYAGLVVVPLTTKFGPDAVRFRLEDSSSRVLFGRRGDLTRVSSGWSDAPDLTHVVCSDDPGDLGQESTKAILPMSDALAGGEVGVFAPQDTHPDDPALLIYTSGTTGNPKGALHAHRVLVGHMPGVRSTHEDFPQPGDRMWTPAEWAWIGGLLDVLFPSLACGVPVVACQEKFTPELARHMFGTLKVRNSFMPPTALKHLRAAGVSIGRGQIRSLASGGESLGAELQVWSRTHLGCHINEFYGQTEMNIFIGQDRSRWQPAEGSMGRAVPGFSVRILNPDGTATPVGETGEICVHTPNPGEFLGYWNQPEKTREKYHRDYLRTGDLGSMDADGNVYFSGRTDDVISSAGYRIGPSEIEETLMQSPHVALAAVVGQPDETRGEVVAAYVVLREGITPTEELRQELQAHVKATLAFYQYPRILEFVDELPMTPTGKIQRRKLRQ
ncbi:acyl-CoA synthetase [Brevibacterium daeguense]|uniref:Acyl-CoA synthetase n=1 Tax=Brevibacterium daeguense TaxID=909936 RepID=A0ABP8EI75_9MICO|nr:AMP-binding protein [Brevibacterium daeguense]